MMRKVRFSLLAVTACLAALPVVSAEERYVERDGVTYRETRRLSQRPSVETVWKEREETVYRDRLTTEVQEVEKTVLSPVTEYEWEPRVAGVWNPFKPARVEYHLVPKTRWEQRIHTVRTPVTTRELVPEVRTVRVPSRKLAMVEREEVERVEVSSIPVGVKVTRIDGDSVGGVAQLQGDPPRQGRVLQR